VKVTASGIPVGRFSLATNEKFKDKSGNFQDRTEWHNVVVWQKLAEIVGEFVSNGPRKADNAKPIAPAVGAPGISDDELPF
jgi:single stranded DNA-binding protein